MAGFMQAGQPCRQTAPAWPSRGCFSVVMMIRESHNTITPLFSFGRETDCVTMTVPVKSM